MRISKAEQNSCENGGRLADRRDQAAPDPRYQKDGNKGSRPQCAQDVSSYTPLSEAGETASSEN